MTRMGRKALNKGSVPHSRVPGSSTSPGLSGRRTLPGALLVRVPSTQTSQQEMPGAGSGWRPTPCWCFFSPSTSLWTTPSPWATEVKSVLLHFVLGLTP